MPTGPTVFSCAGSHYANLYVLYVLTIAVFGKVNLKLLHGREYGLHKFIDHTGITAKKWTQWYTVQARSDRRALARHKLTTLLEYPTTNYHSLVMISRGRAYVRIVRYLQIFSQFFVMFYDMGFRYGLWSYGPMVTVIYIVASVE